MGANSKIEWTHHTFNPWMGCAKVSPGCVSCYAESENCRYGRHLWGPDAPRQRTSEPYWRQPLKWNAAAEREGQRVSKNSTAMGVAGDPDLYGTIDGRHFEIEVKRLGSQLTELQAQRLREGAQAGAITGVAYTAEDALRILGISA